VLSDARDSQSLDEFLAGCLLVVACRVAAVDILSCTRVPPTLRELRAPATYQHKTSDAGNRPVPSLNASLAGKLPLRITELCEGFLVVASNERMELTLFQACVLQLHCMPRAVLRQ
jgi:hypothetical protein